MNKLANTNVNYKNIIPVLIQVLCCLFILVFPLYIITQSDHLDIAHYYIFFVRAIVLMILFYINYLWLIEKLLFKRRFFLYALINIIVVVILYILKESIIESIVFNNPHLLPPIVDQGLSRPPPKMHQLGAILLSLLAIGFSITLKVTIRWNKDSIKLETIKSSQLEADLRMLRSQLNPHFLFNTLNNIYSLITIDADKAQDSIHRLSSLLRYILYENNDRFVPMHNDLEFTQDYVDLMQLRLTKEVKLDMTIENNSSDDLIAPFMFMTLIENAFKHGVNTGNDSYININIVIERGKGVLCKVENSRSDKENMEKKISGIGLDNLQKRLDLLYPKSYFLHIEETSDSFTALLRIDFNGN